MVVVRLKGDMRGGTRGDVIELREESQSQGLEFP